MDRGVLPTRHVTRGVSVLPSGPPMVDPIKALSSDRMRRLLADATKRFDWIVVDTPPTVLLPDAHLLRDSVDAVVFVVQAGASPYRVVQRAVEALGADRIAGVVLNQVVGADLNAAYGYSGRSADDAYVRRVRRSSSA
jgi:Mrp family chromosome partitioning ATPase